eukprot:1155474-Pelagomonas_calceolata.AAC.11
MSGQTVHANGVQVVACCGCTQRTGMTSRFTRLMRGACRDPSTTSCTPCTRLKKRGEMTGQIGAISGFVQKVLQCSVYDNNQSDKFNSFQAPTH